MKRWIIGIAVLAKLGGPGLAVAAVDTFGTGANQFTIEFVPISGVTNPTSGVYAGDGLFVFTGVDHDYRMGTYEITNDQWNKFRAAYGPVTGADLGYSDNDVYTGLNVPKSRLTWFEAAQFVNWLNTSTGHQAAYKFTGTQGTDDYAFATWSPAEAAGGTNFYRHKDAFYFLPTENEWVKAAYWNGTTLQQWATQEILIGAKQNRVVNVTVLVAAGVKFLMPVSCAEAGRWRSRQSNTSAVICRYFPQFRGENHLAGVT